MNEDLSFLSGSETAVADDESHYRDALAKLWALRILLDLKGIKGLMGFPKRLTSDGTILNAVGLGDLEDEDIELPAFKQKLNEQLDESQRLRPAISGPLSQNLDSLADLVGLSDVDKQLLGFTVILHSHQGLDETADMLGSLTVDKLMNFLSRILHIDEDKVSEALTRKGVLTRTGLLTIDRSDTRDFKNKLEIPSGFVDVMFESHGDVLSLLSQFFSEASDPELDPADFAYLDDQYSIFHDLIEKARRQSLAGVNVLLYGPPGTGKTELARVISRVTGTRGFEISYLEDDDQSPSNEDRFKSYQLSQYALENQKDALLIFDEIEDVFTGSVLPFFGRMHSNKPRKAWTNRLLEENPVPAIWISNEIEHMDPAYLRRFSFTLKLDVPPRHVRERILKQHFKQAGVRPEWIHRIASDSRVSPAMAATASRVVSAIGNDTASEAETETETILERLLNNSLSAIGHTTPLKKEKKGMLTYRAEALNPDHDLKQIVSGMNHNPHSRLCLYGPPGTGKTYFGHYVAKTLDKPLLVKRASDLLSMWVGETEKLIAKMFHEASRDNAVLLLDEADSFLRDRRDASHSWEVTQVNELLTQMESYEGLFICSTNLVDDLDEASIRRFDFKIKMDYLKLDQAWVLFRQTIKDSGAALPRGRSPWKAKLSRLENLTPGDFALVLRQNRLSIDSLTPELLYEALERESAFKGNGQQNGIGFTAAV